MKNVEDIFPLTPMQRLMLMHSLRVQGSSTLVNQFRYRIHGPLDVDRFRSAWQVALDRHQALRTAFIWEDVPQPLQVVRREVSLPFETIDLSTTAGEAREDALEAIQAADRELGFDLRRAPLMRLELIRLGETEHVLVWSRHHLILDLWSVEILFEEVFATYDARPGPPAPGRFRDYIAWVQGQDPERARAHWTGYLEGLPGPSPLFARTTGRAQWSRVGQSVSTRSLGIEVLDGLTAMARANGLTAGTVIQGAIALMAAARTGARDVVFGLTVSGRPQEVPVVERTMGSFINNVPVRVMLPDDARVLDVLAQIQRAQAARAPFEHVSPTEIQHWSGLAPDAPLFDLLVLLQSPGAAAPLGSSLRVEAMDGPFDSAMPMTLAIERDDDGLALTAVHDAALVPSATAEAVLDELSRCLVTVMEDPQARVATVLPAAAVSRDPPRPVSLARPVRTPAGGAEAVLLDIWRRTLGMPDVGLDDDFFALGATSVQASIAFSEIERDLGRSLPLSTLFSAGSVRQLLEALDLGPAPASSLVGMQRHGSRPALLAVSGIGGNVVGLAPLARLLGREQPFYGLQPRGLNSDEAPLAEIEQIAAHFIAESQPVRGGRVVLMGLCFGANVTLEMAQQLARQGRPPALVIVLDPVFDDRRAPSGPVKDAPPAPRATLLRFLLERARLYYATYRDATPRERRQWLREKRTLWAAKLRQRDLLEGSRLELRARRVVAANLAAAERYRPKPYSGAVRVLLSSRVGLEPDADPRLRWLSQVVGPDTPSARVPGSDTVDALDHHAPLVADRLRSWIDELD